MSEECRSEIDQQGKELVRLDERTRAHAESLKRLDQDKLNRQELEPVTWQLRSIVLAAISLMGGLVLYVLTRAKL